MAYQLILEESAAKDMQAVYGYYENISPGLGERFLEQLRLVFRSISLHPTNFGYIDAGKGLRDKLLKVFPYSVIYEVEDDIVNIVGIFNCYQDPIKKYRRR